MPAAKPFALKVFREWPEPQVGLVDKQGRVTDRDGTAITASGPQVSGKRVELTIDGLVIFRDLILTGDTTVAITITYSSPGLPSISSTVTLTPVATQLVFITAPPATAQDGKVFPVAVVVEARSASGVPVAGVTVTAALTGTVPPGSSIVGPTTDDTDSAGRAQFAHGINDGSM